MITIFALLLLSTIILRVNSNFLYTSGSLIDSKLGVLAVSLATSMIEQANSLSFDENTDTSAVSVKASLSETLGPDSGEFAFPADSVINWDSLSNDVINLFGSKKVNFDDFDDFDGFTVNTLGDSTFNSAEYNISCSVDYITEGNPNQITNQQSWHKKISVTVSSPSLTDTIRMSSIYSYWFYR